MQIQAHDEVQVPLTLVMPVKLDLLQELKATLQLLRDAEVEAAKLERALNTVGTVHNTRFVILEDKAGKWAKLIVIALYDGSVDDYIRAFARELNDQFNALFKCIADAPEEIIPVIDNVDKFIKYVKDARRPAGERQELQGLSRPDGPGHLRSHAPEQRRRADAMSELDLNDIQGLILRGYRMEFASHLVLRINDADAFRRVLAPLTEENLESPYITVAEDWKEKPPEKKPATSCVNIAFTYAGLEALGVRRLDTFPEAFREGARARAKDRAGETGPNDPGHWCEEELTGREAHVILSVHAKTEKERDQVISDIGFTEAATEDHAVRRAPARRRCGALRLRRRHLAAHHRGQRAGHPAP